MAIQLRRGNKADLDTTQLKQGEPVVVLDTKEFGFKGRENEMIWGVPANRTLAGISLEKDVLLSELIAAGVARGASDGSGNALNALTSALADNALSLGGVGAGNYPQISSGTWTPSLIGSVTAGNPTYSAQNGVWYLIGQVCICIFTVGITAIGGMEGELFVGGLPYACLDAAPINISYVLGASLIEPYSAFSGYSTPGTTFTRLTKMAKTGDANANTADITNNFSLNAVQCIYRII